MSAFLKKSRGFFSYSSTHSGLNEPYVDEDGTMYYDAEEAGLHPDASPDGNGIMCSDKQVVERQKKAVIEIMKSMGKKLLSGKFDLLKVSLPVKIFEARSYLQKLGDPLVYPQIMMKAVHAKDPVERLKWVTTYFVAGYHLAFKSFSKPFNPILGETWHASLADGTEVFMEQISHHPPISAFQIIGPGSSYYFHGHSQPTVTYKANAVTSYALGERSLEFLDGTVIDITFPEYNVRGLVGTGGPKGDLGGQVEFVDRHNGLIVSLTFGKIEGKKGILGRNDAISGFLYRTKVHQGLKPTVSAKLHVGRTSSWLGLPTGASHHLRRSAASSNAFSLGEPDGGMSSSLEGGVPPGEDMNVPLAHCQGNWLSHFDWDEERYWTLFAEEPYTWIPDPNPIPSDCSFREDLSQLAAGNLTESQAAKDQMENAQRKDAKLRMQGFKG